ncbi:hypothetical protein GOODEAATRI_000727 [Goodea atripinnis]|uniref:Uncharacterized protein n=1 Tax=Goodea atripinnis TaxID=208336 RepID=A0ABV0N6X2_9TELE
MLRDKRRKARRRALVLNWDKDKTKSVDSTPLGFPHSPQCLHAAIAKTFQATNRKFTVVKLTSVISIFTHSTKCFYVYVKPFVGLIFHVYVLITDIFFFANH